MGTAGGATRAALVQHQARRDNMADVSAKDGSQVSSCSSSTLVSTKETINYTMLYIPVCIYTLVLKIPIVFM